jgi:sugar lactone lactonase YvrE
MRKALLALTILIILGGVALVVLRLIRAWRQPPTVVGWQAQVTTLAGNGAPTFLDSSQPRVASWADPFGIVVDPTGAVFVADAGESNRVRKIAPNGIVSTLAGGNEGFADGQGAQASFNSPSGLALDSEGNIYVADTGNHRIRKITPQGLVSTIAGDGVAGYVDGPAATARFDGPMGVAVDTDGNVYVADSYNDRIRKISVGQVTTIAGPGVATIERAEVFAKDGKEVKPPPGNSGRPGYADGPVSNAMFDTPGGIVVASDHSLIVADTGNNQLRRISPEGQVTTLPLVFPPGANPAYLTSPIGLVITHDGFLYVTELNRSRIIQVASDGSARIVAGGNPGYSEGHSSNARFNQPSGLALDRQGDLYVADSGNFLIRKLSRTAPDPTTDSTVDGVIAEVANAADSPRDLIPRINPDTIGQSTLLWPLDPQDRPHEVVATIGEVRGSFDSKDSRERLHSGLDVFAAYGDVVRVIRSEKVTSPLANWGFNDLNEGFRVGLISYVHMHVGRNAEGQAFEDSRFIHVLGGDGKTARIRVRRGTRFRPGEAVGTVNRMYHVHLNVGPPRAEINPLFFSPIGFSDRIPPTIEKDGIQLFDESGAKFAEKESGRLVVRGKVRIVVDAFDRTDMNAERRRLGLYRLGYQLLKSDGTPVQGFEKPRLTMEFNRLAGDREAPKLTYAEESGITVYGSATTRFLYEVTNTVRDGRATRGVWDTSELSSGDYILRVLAADYSGNEAQAGRDLPIRVVR